MINDEFIIIKQVLNSNERDKIFKIINNNLNDLSYKKHDKWNLNYMDLKRDNLKLKSRFYNIINFNSYIKSLVLEKVYPIIKELTQINESNLLVDNITLRLDDSDNDRLETFHQDSGLLSSNALVAWMPITNAHKDLGGIKIVKESTKIKNVVQVKYPEYRNDFGVKKEFININNIKDIILDAGDLIVFKSTLFHASREINVDNHVRVTLCSRWFNKIDTRYNKENEELRVFNLLN